MMLKELIHNTNIENLINKIAELFPEEKDSIVAYEWLVGKLRATDASTRLSDMLIVVYPSIDIFTKDENIKRNEVCGYRASEKQVYDMKLCTHAEWLGMQVAEKSLNYYGTESFLAYVLHDMSFYGFKDTQVRDFVDELEETIEKTEIEDDTFDQLINCENELFNFNKKDIDETIEKNKQSICDMLGIQNPDEISYFSVESPFMI